MEVIKIRRNRTYGKRKGIGQIISKGGKMKKYPPSVSYHDYLIKTLQNEKMAMGYLNCALEEGDPKYFLKALRHVVEALYGMTEASKKTKVSRMSLYRILSEKGNPRWENIMDVLRIVGLRFKLDKAA